MILDNIWQETRKLSRAEKMELVEKLIHQLRIEGTEEKTSAEKINWEQMYGSSKGIWDMDAQEYVDNIREDRY